MRHQVVAAGCHGRLGDEERTTSVGSGQPADRDQALPSLVQSADLDAFRDAVGALYEGGAHAGYLATTVEAMRAGLLLRRQERVWLLLTGLDGNQEIQEDYAPWVCIPDLRDGHIKWGWHEGDEVDYEVRWLSGDQRQSAWPRYGIVEDLGTYMSRAFRS